MLVSPFVFLIKCKNKHLAVWVARSFLCAADARLDSKKQDAFCATGNKKADTLWVSAISS